MLRAPLHLGLQCTALTANKTNKLSQNYSDVHHDLRSQLILALTLALVFDKYNIYYISSEHTFAFGHGFFFFANLTHQFILS